MKKERHRWKPEEDAVLAAYVQRYGPREWHLVSQRMSISLERDAKSCLERWKNYLKPGIKKGSLTQQEQELVIQLQAKHGNKWKKIAAHLPGRTAKRLGKWWEVFREKQLRESNTESSVPEPGKYDRILENFAEKLVKERPWLTLSVPLGEESGSAIGECCEEVKEGYDAWAAHRKEAEWRLKRVELQMEAEKACRKRKKREEIAEKMRMLKEDERIALERIEAECREKTLELRNDAEAKEKKLTEQWAAKHDDMMKFVEQMTHRH